MCAAHTRATRVGVRVASGAIVILLLAAQPRRALSARCDATFCRCVSASELGISADELVHRQRDRAERVVLGKVIGIDTLAARMVPHGPTDVAVRSLVARVIVSRVWKGARTDTLRVVFGSVGVASSCDLELKAGATYVLFASRGEGSFLQTRQCTGTAPELAAATTISALGAGEVPDR